MDMKKIVAVIIAGTVCALIFGALLPVWAETTSSDDVFTNESGLIRATAINDDTDVILTWDYTNPSTITVGDVDIEIPSGAYPITFAFSETWMIRIQPGTNGSIQVYDSENVTATISAGVATSTNMEVELTGDSVTFTAGENTSTYPVNGGLVIDPKGEYVLKKANESAYFSESSTAYIAGYSYHALGNTGAVVGMYTFNLEDGLTVLSTYPPTFTYTETVNKTDVDNYVSLVKLSSIVLNASDGINTGTITYNQFFVPVEVSAEKSVHMSGALATLVNIIPLLIAFGLVIGIAGVVIHRRM